MGLGPAEAVHPFFDQPLGPVFIGFMALPGLFVRFSGTAEEIGQPLRKVGRAQPPAAPEGVPRFGRFAFPAALFHALLKPDAVLGGVALNAVGAQEPVHAQTGRPARGC